MESLVVTRAESGQKLLNFLSRRVDAPTGDLQRWIRTGQVRRNKGRTKPFDRVEEGDEIRVPPFAVLTGKSRFGEDEPPFPDILFENEELLVINKRAGLPVQDGTGHDDSVASRLRFHYRTADFVPAPAHRLDKDTSGILLAGKTYACQRRLSDLFARDGEGTLVKEYLAWAWGRWLETGPILLRDNLVRREGEKVRRASLNGDEALSRLALSAAVAVETRMIAGREASLMLVRLMTGRTHQIRVQLAERGHPVVGDPVYGNKKLDAGMDLPSLKLHAFRVVLPESGEFIVQPGWDGEWSCSDIVVCIKKFSASLDEPPRDKSSKI